MVKYLLEVKKHSQKYCEEMVNGHSLDAMDRYKCQEQLAIKEIVSHESF